MDKKLANIEQRIPAFLTFLKERLNVDVFNFLEKLSRVAEVHIFSGVIRNFFLNYFGETRDLDLVVKCEESIFLKVISPYIVRKNSFGGYKLNVTGIDIDIWFIDKTWAYVNNKVNKTLFVDYSLPNTAFFNFSAAVFDYNNNEFIISKEFLVFLDNKELDLVLESNPLPELCLVNTIYYHFKFKLKISIRLMRYFVNYFPAFKKEDFDAIQLKHFGSIIYTFEYLKVYYKILENEIMERAIKSNFDNKPKTSNYFCSDQTKEVLLF